MAHVLVVDDSELILQMLQMVLGQAGHRVATAASWSAAQALYAQEPPDVVVTDLNLPDTADAIGAFAALGEAPIIVVSGRPQAELDALVATSAAAGAVSKDAGLPGIAATLPALIDRARGA